MYADFVSKAALSTRHAPMNAAADSRDEVMSDAWALVPQTQTSLIRHIDNLGMHQASSLVE
jgi:hypothetical protein